VSLNIDLVAKTKSFLPAITNIDVQRPAEASPIKWPKRYFLSWFTS